MVAGESTKGSLRTFNPNALLVPLWQSMMRSGPVLGAVAAVPGLVVVGSGHYMMVSRATDGLIMFRGAVNSLGTSSPAVFFGAPTFAHGVLYEGDTHGYVYAYSVNGA